MEMKKCCLNDEITSKLLTVDKMYRLRRIFEKLKVYQSANISFNLTDIGEGIKEVVIKEWYVKIGDKVNQFDNICEVQSDKASATITSRYDGVVKKLYYDIDETALVGKPLVDIEITEDNVNESDKTIQLKQETKNDIPSIPSVKRLAKEHKIDLTVVKGTGKNGRILKEDVLKYLEINTIGNENEIVVPIKNFQKAMIKSMTNALKVPHFIYSDEIIITKLSNIRKTINHNIHHDMNLSYMPFFIKAISNALKQFPILNSQLDENCENIIYKNQHNIGIAMDTQCGLAVPVIRNVEKISIPEINCQLNKLLQSGKKGNFSIEDLSGATFTISNIGSIGGTYMKPIILVPQTAIIALGKINVQPKFDASNNIISEEIINLSGAADHRIIDGATMARFINLFKKQIENPYYLFLNLQ